ncbi:MAG TPA: peptidoglycan-binding protein [Candidatus Pullichristensenella excrementigallinarum]|uniref:Peptidoglycan-binding protein n=1 Tax=Candidatus Pullichristensenella excrementigallinarum TaxID=2840907 RepID=A0A9D1LBJ7_9FIRM|nr:peptidoglycan-binding protein [Candidatus Pullichristensenella excrementigallinarum]
MKSGKILILLLAVLVLTGSLCGLAEAISENVPAASDQALASSNSAARGSRENPISTLEAFSFETEVLANGVPRTGNEADYQTLRISMTLENFLTPDYFARNYSRQFKLQGTEAGAEFSLTLEAGEGEWIAQDIVGFTLENEAGDVCRGYQLMDREMAGSYDVLLQPGAAVKFYKRFDFNQLEEPKYLVASYWQGGEEHKAYFVLEELIDYPTLSRGSRGEDVQAMQQWLIGLGYLDDVADGIFGQKTEAAVIAAQQAGGFEANGIADTPFQRYLFKQEIQLPEEEAPQAE